MTDEAVGILICCGRRLARISQEETSAPEASRDRCCTSLAMDPRDDSTNEKGSSWTQPSATRNPMSASEFPKNVLTR